jgi:hypothetical protein
MERRGIEMRCTARQKKSSTPSCASGMANSNGLIARRKKLPCKKKRQ